MKEKTKKVIIVLFVIFILVAIVAYLQIEFNANTDFWKINISETLTVIVAVVFTYYFCELENNERIIKKKIEEVLNDIQNTIIDKCDINPGTLSKNEKLKNLKYINNKILILEKLVDEDLKDDIKYVKEEYQKYKNFISQNINEPKEYFERDERMILIKNYLDNMDNKIDLMISKLYKK